MLLLLILMMSGIAYINFTIGKQGLYITEIRMDQVALDDLSGLPNK